MSSRSPLILCDLTGSERSRRIAGMLGRMYLRAHSRLTRAPAIVLGYSSSGHGIDADEWPPGHQYLKAADLLDRDAIRNVEGWALRASIELVARDGEALFPVVDGVDIGRLNLLRLQLLLSDIGMLATLAERASLKTKAGTLVLIGSDEAMTGAVIAQLRGGAVSVRRISSAGVDHIRSALQSLRSSSFFRRSPGPAGLMNPLPTGRAPFLLISENTPQAQTFDPVEHALGTSGHTLRLQYVATPRAALVTDSRTIAYEMLPSGDDPALRARVKSWQGAAVRTAARCTLSPLTGETPLRLNLAPVVRAIYATDVAPQIAHLQRAREILEQVNPEVLIVGNDRWWVGQAFVEIARQLGIPSLCIQDGTSSEAAVWSWLSADRVAASGPSLCRQLQMNGVSESRCVVTGQPRYDSLSGVQLANERQRVRTALQLDQEAYYALFAAQPAQDPSYPRRVLNALLAVPGMRVLLRPHPSTPITEYQELVAQSDVLRVSLQSQPRIDDLLFASNLLVTQHSTVALEAAALGIPVITANFSGVPDVVPYSALGVSLGARNPAQVTALATDLMNGSAAHAARPASDAVADLIGPLDGRAAHRIATLAHGMRKGARQFEAAQVN